MKKQIRVIGIDDTPFGKKKNEDVLVIGSIYRGGDYMDGLITTYIKKDGNDSTKKLISMITGSKFYRQLKAIFLDGIALGGFNIIDINELSEKTQLPVITIIRKKPDKDEIRKILKDIGMEEKIMIINKFPKIEKIDKIYVQRVNISLDDTIRLLKICITNSDIPECVRMSHIIGSGVILGQSKGRA